MVAMIDKLENILHGINSLLCQANDLHLLLPVFQHSEFGFA